MNRKPSFCIMVILITCVHVTIIRGQQETAITNLFNTGVDDAGITLTNWTLGDPHYNLTAVPAGSTNGLRALTTRGAWLAPNPLSNWIGPANPGTNGYSDYDDYGPPGNYTYETTFVVNGSNPSAVSIVGRYSTDNKLIGVYLNGASTGITNNNSGGYTSWHNFKIPPSSNFVAGENKLDFIVSNDNGPTGLRVEMTASTKLAMEQSGTNTILSWPVYATGFTLQSTTNPLATNWSAVAPAPAVVDTNNVVTNSVSNVQKFYRLKQ